MAITWTPAASQAAIQHAAPNLPSFSVTLASTPLSTDQVVIFVGSTNPAAASAGATLLVNSQSATFFGSATNREGAFTISGSLIASTSLTIVPQTFGGGSADQGVLVGVVSGALSSPAPSWSGAFPNSADPQQFGSPLTIPSGGLGVFSMEVNSNSHPSSINNFTQDAIIDASGVSGTQMMLIGHQFTSGSWNPQVNGYSFLQVELNALIFSPAPVGPPQPPTLGRVGV